MAELGSVFDEDDGDERPRGPDLRVSVEVPRAALGATLRAPVPARIAADGELVERALRSGDEPGSVELHLPDELPDRAVLRLRGHGGEHPTGRAGDLLVLVEIVDRGPRDDELITRSNTGIVAGAADRLADGTDITWWLLLALALLGGGVVAVLAL